MAEIKPTGVDIVSGQDKPVEAGVDTLSVDSIASKTPTDGDGLNLTITSSNGVGTDRNGGWVDLVAGTGTGTGANGKIYFTTDGADQWMVEEKVDAEYGGASSMLRRPFGGGAAIVQGGPGDLTAGGTLVIRGGNSGFEGNAGSEGGGDVYITGGTGALSGVAGGVFIGSYATDPTGTDRIVIGAELEPAQTVEIYNVDFLNITNNFSAGNITTPPPTQGLILLKPGYQTFGPNTGVVLNVGPTYYDPNTGQTIRIGESVYILGDGTNNFVRGGDGTDLINNVVFTSGTTVVTYNMATTSLAPASPILPGSVTIRIIGSGDTTYTTVTDNGSGVFPTTPPVLPLGGTIDYTTGAMTGTTDVLEPETQVTVLYALANVAGEPLTPRAGNGFGTGVGGELRLRGGAGGATAAGGNITATAGAGGSTSGTAGSVSISGGTPVDGNGGSVTITGSAGVGTNRSGGDITVTAGTNTGSGVAGDIALRTVAQGTSTPIDRYFINATSRALTNTTATSIFTAAVASNTMVGGSVSLTVRANDATDYQATTVTFNYAAVNDSGTVTSQVTLNTGNTATIASTGTLTVAASAVNGAGIITIQITATSSLTPTTLDATYQVTNNSGQAITVV